MWCWSEAQSGKYYIVVTITNPACISNIRRGSATRTAAASDDRAAEKTQKYDFIPSLPGAVPHTLLYLESSGRLEKQAITLLRDFSDELNPRPLSLLLTSNSACVSRPLQLFLLEANSTRGLNKKEELLL